MSFDQRDYRNALGRFATGVAVVTALSPEGEPLGMTINSFGSVSLEPPLVLWCLDRQAKSREGFLACDAFAVSVLGAEAGLLSDRFAEPGPEKWEGVETETWTTGCPILSDAIAAFECHRHATHPGGDHEILLGRVIGFRQGAEAAPLLFFGGNYASLGRIG